MDNAIPETELGLSIGIISYCMFCFLASLLLFVVLMVRRERTNYVTFITLFVTISTLASIAQQIHYALQWRDIKTAQFREIRAGGLSIASNFGANTAGQAVPFYIQYYCYNVNALFCLLWAFDLFTGSWNIRLNIIRGHNRAAAIAAKTAAILLPAVMVGLVQLPVILTDRLTVLLLGNSAMILNFGIGGIAVALTLGKYVTTRRFLSRNMYGSSGASAGGTVVKRQSMDDRWLVIRFSLAFLVLSGFEAWIVIFQLSASRETSRVQVASEPDFSVDSIRGDITGFIPAASASLGTFIIFGTTAPLRKHYARMYRAFKEAVLRRRKRTERPDKKSLSPRSTDASYEDGTGDIELGQHGPEFEPKTSPSLHPTLPSPTYQSPYSPAWTTPASWPLDRT